MLHCTAYKEQRSPTIHLQQPYLESDQNPLGQWLFDFFNVQTVVESRPAGNIYNAHQIGVEFRLNSNNRTRILVIMMFMNTLQVMI